VTDVPVVGERKKIVHGGGTYGQGLGVVRKEAARKVFAAANVRIVKRREEKGRYAKGLIHDSSGPSGSRVVEEKPFAKPGSESSSSGKNCRRREGYDEAVFSIL